MKRIFTSLILIPLVLYVVLWGHFWLLFAVTALVAVICYREYSGIVASYGFGALGPLGYAAGLFLLLIQGDAGLLLTALALLALVLAMRAEDLAKALPWASLLVLGVVYVFGSWKFAILLRNQSPYWLLYGLALSWVGDIAAYYVGRTWGKHRLAPRISPGKSWEGSVASVCGSVLFGFFFLQGVLPHVPMAHAIGLSVGANIAGQFGDLAESAMKRGAGVKDSGTLLPGHGGLLDRVDSTLFVLPLVYLYLRVVAG
ncbi:MAG: phosphatidate cytidylyltransferase [Acidobacteria bacterium]|nr:phosphatidate cytidylyltransferase [Acidobacteriota bacterium]